MAWSSSSSALRSPGARLARTARTAWKKPTSSRMRSASSCGTARAKACDSSRHRAAAAGPCRPPARGCAPGPRAAATAAPAGVPVVHGDQSKPWKRPQQTSYFSSITATASSWSMRRLARAAALGVGGERLLQLVGEAQVVHHQPAGLVPEHAVHAGDGLHQPVAAHRLVDVHRVQARRVEAGEPHVAHDHDLERVVRVAEALGQRLAARLVADVRLPVERVGGRAGHHDLDARPASSSSSCQSGRSATMLAVQLHADAAAHADDHRLAVHGLEPLLEVLDEVAGRPASRRFSAPTTASSCAHLVLSFSLRSTSSPSVASSNSGSMLRPLGLVERELGQPALVVDRHRGAVLRRRAGCRRR